MTRRPDRRRAAHQRLAIVQGSAAVGFLGFGFALILLARWQLGWPSQPPPVVGPVLETILGDRAPGGRVLPELYLQLVAMHGTIMVFLGVVPLAVGGFGGLLVPQMIGARSMALPRVHLASVVLFLMAGATMLGSFLLPEGAARSGWTSYPPLADLEPTGQTWWLVGMLLLGLSSIAGAIVWIVTIVQRRAPEVTFGQMPFFVWTQLVTAFLLLLAFPPFLVAAVFQLMDRVAGTAFFLPHGLAAGEAGTVATALEATERGGGSPVLWQHLFWFLAHPEVYVLVLPALGLVAAVLVDATGRPLWGRRAAIGSVLAVGVLSFLVWAHHMFLTGMGAALSTFFQTTTLIISVPSVVIVTSLVLTLWGGALRWSTSTLFAVAFLPLFGLGGLTGLPLGLAASDVHLHDTWYVVGHFHLVVAPGTLFALFAGLYHFWPTLTGRSLDERLGRLHFWLSTPAMLLTFGPMLVQGLAGLHRRLWDGGASYPNLAEATALHRPVTWAALLLAVAQAPLLWAVGRDLLAARFRQRPDPTTEPLREVDIDRQDTGWTTPGLATALALAASAMACGALVASAVLLRSSDPTWPADLTVPLWLPALGSLLLVVSVVAVRAGGTVVGAASAAFAALAWGGTAWGGAAWGGAAWGGGTWGATAVSAGLSTSHNAVALAQVAAVTVALHAVAAAWAIAADARASTPWAVAATLLSVGVGLWLA